MPTEIVDTPYGKYGITAKGDKAWLHTTYDEAGTDQHYLTMNGISFRGSIYMKYEMYYDGKEMVKGWHRDNSIGGMYLKRVDNNWAGITTNMIRKVYDDLIPWACRWLVLRPNFVWNGWVELYGDELIKVGNEVKELGKLLLAAKAREIKAAQIYTDFIDGLVFKPEPDDKCACGHIRQSHSASCQEYITDSYRHCDCMVFEGEKVTA